MPRPARTEHATGVRVAQTRVDHAFDLGDAAHRAAEVELLIDGERITLDRGDQALRRARRAGCLRALGGRLRRRLVDRTAGTGAAQYRQSDDQPYDGLSNLSRHIEWSPTGN